MAVAFGKGARHMCSLYVSVKAAVPIEETGRRVMPLSGPDGRVESWPNCPYGKHAIGFGRDRRRADQQVREADRLLLLGSNKKFSSMPKTTWSGQNSSPLLPV